MGLRVFAHLGGAIGSEIAKLRTLPAVLGTILATVLSSTALGALFGGIAGSGVGSGPGETTGTITATALQFVDLGQVGFILLGILTVASEYPRAQIRTTLLGVPDRSMLLAAKSMAYLAVATGTAVLAVGGAALASILTANGTGVSEIGWARELGALIGAAVYLVLIGLLGSAVALLVRNLVVATAVMSTLVLVLSPILSMFTELAGYLPDRAGSWLFRSAANAGGPLDPGTGVAVFVGWILVTSAIGTGLFLRRDA
ncbi:hypothetical protein [Actinoalloteichus hymeniacidonis]|uniref:ABC-2 family transporter protein n=1 Tax=Actinoalloteichus hymeniacidonis TaxID=340345 RepID=A0AAC9HNW1_9PSEU|nr:hypothetical protein [Actinoalloteichus hymeniacidonis]AOS62241.1 ABC-2 family transporter protein [Actinoalloteichus hymeniacidonis]MBB5909733.1 ABC-type transport system involved in multi-copper enzyme maturation permease subunit [Actinoalloteichus hymeniacidonis]